MKLYYYCEDHLYLQKMDCIIEINDYLVTREIISGKKECINTIWGYTIENEDQTL